MPENEQTDGRKQTEDEHVLSSQPGAHGAGDGGIHFARGARQLGVLTAWSMASARKRSARKQARGVDVR